MAVLQEQSDRFKQQRMEERNNRGALSSLYKLISRKPKQTNAEFMQNLKQMRTFVGFLITVASCCTLFIFSKTYHAHLEKQKQLDALLKNPNARVAAGKRGKQVVKKIMAKKQELDSGLGSDESDEEQTLSAEDKIDSLLKAAKAKKKLRAANVEVAEELCYTAPLLIQEPTQPQPVAQPQSSYLLVEPQAPKTYSAPAPAQVTIKQATAAPK